MYGLWILVIIFTVVGIPLIIFNAMADAIYSICNNESLYEYLKVEGRKEVDSITWEDVALRLRRMYEKVLGW